MFGLPSDSHTTQVRHETGLCLACTRRLELKINVFCYDRKDQIGTDRG